MAEIPRKFKWDGMGTPVAPGTPGTHGTFDFHKYSGAISGMDWVGLGLGWKSLCGEVLIILSRRFQYSPDSFKTIRTVSNCLD